MATDTTSLMATPAASPPPAQPEPPVHLAVHRDRSGQVLMGLLALACAPVELAEAEVAVGDERAQASRARPTPAPRRVDRATGRQRMALFSFHHCQHGTR
jgi:hypothetical protein